LRLSKSKSAHSFLNGVEEVQEAEQSEMKESLRGGRKLKWPRKEPKPGGGRRQWKKKGMLTGNKSVSKEGDFLAPQQDILPAHVLAPGTMYSGLPTTDVITAARISSSVYKCIP